MEHRSSTRKRLAEPRKGRYGKTYWGADTIGTNDKLRKAMNTLGGGETELARETGLSRSTVRRMLSRDYAGNLYSWYRAAGYLGVPLSWLLSDGGSAEPETRDP